MDGYTLNAARTIREYESSIQRPKAERTINDSILSALLRGDELPEMDVKAIRQYGIQCSEYLDFGYDVDASLSGMLSPHAVLEPRPNNGYGTKTNDNGCSNVIASLYGRDNFTSYLARAANEEKILYIDSEKYEQMEKELPRYGGTRFPPALAALSMDIIIPSSYICKMKAEINPKLSDCEREHNSLNRTMHFKVADSRRNRLAQDRDKPRNITPRYDDDSHDSQ